MEVPHLVDVHIVHHVMQLILEQELLHLKIFTLIQQLKRE